MGYFIRCDRCGKEEECPNQPPFVPPTEIKSVPKYTMFKTTDKGVCPVCLCSTCIHALDMWLNELAGVGGAMTDPCTICQLSDAEKAACCGCPERFKYEQLHTHK